MHHVFSVNGQITLTLTPKSALEDELFKELFSQDVIVEHVAGNSKDVVIRQSSSKPAVVITEDDLIVD